MAYMTVRLSAGSYDPTTNSTPVSATVSITWDTSASYDQTNGIGTLTIGNSYSTTFSTNYNASRTSSGTQILGGGSTTIYHNSTGDSVQVVASATSSRYSASDIITLPGGTPSSGSGGNTGGNTGGDSGDSGDNTGGSSGSGSSSDIVGDPSSSTSRIRQVTPIGIGASLLSYELFAVTSNGLVPFGSEDYVYIDTAVRCYFNLPDGYEVIATYARYGSNSIYDCTEKDIMHERGADYCEFFMTRDDIYILFPIVSFSGDYYATDMTQRYGYGSSSNTSGWVDCGNHSKSLFMRENGSVTALRFTTPDFVGRFKKVRFGLAISAANITGTTDACYALCSSDENCNNYVGAGTSVVDETQIATGVTSILCNEYFRKDVPSIYNELTLDVKLQPNTTYYLYLWGGYAVAAAARYHNIVFIVEPYYINVDNGTDFIPYEIYIDNGISWDLYTAYIDNGTNWEIYS